MGSARRLLLLAVLALAFADARMGAQSTLTLSPNAGSLISTRDESTTTDTTDTSSGAVIGSAASDSTKVTEAPEAESSTDADADAASDSGVQDTTDAPSSASATVSPASSADPSAETQTDVPAAAAATTSSKSSTASVDTLNESSSGLSTGDSSTMSTVLPIVFGSLACVGAIVMAVTYKKKRDAKNAGDGSRSSSDCEYTNGANFTPDNRALSTVQEDAPPTAIQVPVLGAETSAALSATVATADFTSTNSSVSTLSSPFGSTRCKARVSSPVPSCYSSSETNTEFPDTFVRHDGGSNVVLTFQEVATDSHVAPQVQL